MLARHGDSAPNVRGHRDKVLQTGNMGVLRPTLADRVLAQVIAQDSVIVGHTQVGAWTRVR